MATLTSEQLEDLQIFLKEWLRHTGRTQADLRRALRASSIRMPVLLEELAPVHRRDGLAGLAERLCAIESLWLEEESFDPDADTAAGFLSPDLEASFGQLDLLLREIRLDAGET